MGNSCRAGWVLGEIPPHQALSHSRPVPSAHRPVWKTGKSSELTAGAPKARALEV